MKNEWMKNLFGYVTVQITGIGVERFLNRLIKERVPLWNIKRKGEKALSFQMFVKDIPAIQRAVRHHRVKVRFTNKSGIPFFYRRAKQYTGFFVSLLFAVLTILLLSNMIWKIEIRGASPDLEYKMMKQLKEMGIRKGQLQFLAPDPQRIQRKMTDMNDEVTWIGVELKGTTYHFQVVEKERPEESKPASPQNLIAKKEAVIVDYFIKSGQISIKRNQFVKPGQLLVSGIIGTEEEKRWVPAEGKVFGKTWYKADVSVKLKSKWPVLTGEKREKKYINLFHFSIPIWGFQKPPFQQSQAEQQVTDIKFLKWTLPISFVTERIYEIETVEKSYSEKEGRQRALDQAKRDLLASLPPDAEIEDEKILHESLENGTLKISVLYEVIENIVQAQPIIPQD